MRLLEFIYRICPHIHLQKLSDGGGQSNERGSSVEDNTGIIKLGSGITKSDCIESNFPVSLAPQRDLCDLARVVVLVNATKNCLRLFTRVGVTEIEGEDRLIDQFLLNHVVKGRNNVVHADCIVAQAQDAVEPAEGESEAWLGGSLGEVLLLDLEISDLECILRYKAAKRTRPIPNLELGSVFLVG